MMNSFAFTIFKSLFMVTFLITFTGTEGHVYVSGKGDKGPVNGNVTLSCTYTSDANTSSLVILIWQCSRGSHRDRVIRSFYGSIDYGTGCTTSSMRGRVKFVGGTHGDASIRLNNISRLDAGLYKCEVQIKDDGGGTSSTDMTLDILVPVSNVTPAITSPRKEGDFAEFTCKASGTHPITYTLYKVGGVTSGDRWSNASGVFTLSNIQRADAGEYRCTADNEAKRPQTSDAVKLEVYYAPSSLSLTSSPSELTQQENSQVTLTCTAGGGHPAPDVTIYRHGVSKASGNSTATLTLTLTKSDNQVALVCNATSAGITGQISSNEIKYNVQFPHSVSVNASVNPVVEGTDTILICQPSGGNPQTVTSYEWRGPSPIATKSSLVIGSANQLTLNNVTYMHAGKYDCSVSNMGGTGSNNLELIVLYTAKLDPRVSHQHKIATEYNQTVTFSLYVIAHPVPTYNWSRFYNNEWMPLLAKSVVISVGLTSNLTIPMTAKTDMVTYICHVKNTVGLEVFTFQLVAAAAPDRPSQLGIVYLSVLSVTLRWTAGFNGGFRQTFSVMYRVAGQTWPDEAQITGIEDTGENRPVQYKVKNLLSNTIYEFRIRAENERENGERKSHYTVPIQGKTKARPSSDSAVIGAVVGSLLAVLVIVSIVAVVFVYRRKHPGTPKKKDIGLINNIQRRDHTEFQNNGFVNNALEADIELGLPPPGDGASSSAAEGAPDVQDVGALYAEVQKPKNKQEDKVTTAPENAGSQLYAEVNKKKTKKDKDIPTEGANEAVSPVYAEVKKDKKKTKANENEGNNAETVGAVNAEVKKENKNKKKEDKKGANAEQMGPVYADVKKDKKNKKKEDKKDVNAEPAGPVYAEVKKDKKDKKKESRPPVPVAPVYEEAAKAKTTEKDKKAAEKSDKKGKKAINKTEDKKGKKMNTAGASKHPGAYGNIQIGEPSQSGAAAENAYQNFAEMQQDAAAAENTYQNMDEMNNQAAAPPLQFEQIRGPDGTLYEDPRNLEFGKKSAAGKPAIQPKSAQKPTEEPTEYAALEFTKKPSAPSGGGK